VGELIAAGGDGGGASGEIVEFEQSGLVGVEQSGSFSLAALQDGVEAVELGSDELILVDRGAGDHGALGSDQLFRVQ